MLITILFVQGVSAQVFIVKSGTASFKSTAPLEVITAKSTDLQGVISMKDHTFLFRIPSESFTGFNSELQQEHFNENYLESSEFPMLVFSGRILEEPDLKVPGTFLVRAKGFLEIHGIRKERIIRGKIIVGEHDIFLSSQFQVQLSDYDIRVPRIVYEKIAPVVDIEVAATMVRENQTP